MAAVHVCCYQPTVVVTGCCEVLQPWPLHCCCHNLVIATILGMRRHALAVKEQLAMNENGTLHGTASQIEKAFLEQNPDVRKAWVHDGIRDIAVKNAFTEVWALKPEWAAQSGAHSSPAQRPALCLMSVIAVSGERIVLF